jgi:sugar phosphate isomerase/epimerase
MKIGSLSAAWSDQPLEEVLDFFCECGLQAVEIGAGNYPGNAHCDPAVLLASDDGCQKFLDAIESRGMVLSALSVHGNPLHPDKAIAQEHHDNYRAAVELAAKIGITEVNGFSGLPAGGPEDKVPNWVVAPWPEDHAEALQYQWCVAVEYWKRENDFLAEKGINMCFEMHPNFLVYNPESLLKLRGACGDQMCANFDPSHLWWQGIEPAAAIRWMQSKGDVIKHFHAKDTMVYDWNTRVNGVLDTKHYGDEINRSWIFRSVGYGHGLEEWNDIISTLRMTGYDGVLSIEHEDSLMSPNEGFKKAIELLKESVIFESPGEMTWA